jgi:hypothetical protein
MNARNLAIGIGLCCSLVSAAPAGAVQNLTGTYEGKIRCESLETGGAPEKAKQDVTVAILDGVDGVSVQVVSFSDQAFVGYVIAVGPKPDLGILSAASCGFASPANLSGGILQGPVKTKAGSDKASIRTVLTFMNGANVAQSCLVTAKRVSTAEPVGVPECAPDTLAE